jgi:hypothetical protein
MADATDRRAGARMTLTERPAARVRGLREVHLLDLSRTGARIEHLDLFRFSASCTWGTLPSITSYRFRSPSHSARVSGPRATAWYTAWGLTPRGGARGRPGWPSPATHREAIPARARWRAVRRPPRSARRGRARAGDRRA